MEETPFESSPKRDYFERLSKQDCIERVEGGMNLNVSEYPLAVIPEGLEFEVEDLRDSAIRFLNASLVVDSFATHEERVAWYNESANFKPGDTKFYLANRLRLNILLGFYNAADTYGGYFEKCHKRGRIREETKLPEMIKDLSLQDYDQYTVEEKLEIVTKAEAIAKTALNELIEFGWIEGEKV